MLLGGPTGLIGDRGSCSADSGVRGNDSLKILSGNTLSHIFVE